MQRDDWPFEITLPVQHDKQKIAFSMTVLFKAQPYHQIAACQKNLVAQLHSIDGQMVRAPAYRAVDSGLIPSRVKPMTFKLVFTASLLDAQHFRNSVENKPASLLVVSVEKALSGTPHL